MINFDTDYMAGAHPKVMQALAETNLQNTIGYGEDDYCRRARKLILEQCRATDSHEVHFLIGGTQTNATFIDAMLRPSQAVIAADTAHINVHEAGAIENGGHRIYTLPNHQGKICPDELRAFLQNFYADDTWTHLSIPGLVYITYPSEYGTLYSLSELQQIAEICHEYHLPLYIDGARMAYALAAQPEISLADLAQIADAFYIGGTKCGLLFGEALVCRKGLLPNFFTIMKAHGAVMAKGRLLGLQFLTLFTDGLYYEIGRQAVALAQQLRQAFIRAGHKVAVDSPTNQQFFYLENEVIDRLTQFASFEYWGPRGATHSTVRFVTSWATKPEEVEQFIQSL